MRPKNLFEWYPPIIEEKLTRVQIHKVMDEFEKEMLKNEVGEMMFGDLFDTKGIGNPNLSSRMAGHLGSAVKQWKKMIGEQ